MVRLFCVNLRPSNYFYYLLLLKVPVQRYEESADFISIAYVLSFYQHMALLSEIYNLEICTKYTVRIVRYVFYTKEEFHEIRGDQTMISQKKLNLMKKWLSLSCFCVILKIYVRGLCTNRFIDCAEDGL